MLHRGEQSWEIPGSGFHHPEPADRPPCAPLAVQEHYRSWQLPCILVLTPAIRVVDFPPPRPCPLGRRLQMWTRKEARCRCVLGTADVPLCRPPSAWPSSWDMGSLTGSLSPQGCAEPSGRVPSPRQLPTCSTGFGIGGFEGQRTVAAKPHVLTFARVRMYWSIRSIHNIAWNKALLCLLATAYLFFLTTEFLFPRIITLLVEKVDLSTSCLKLFVYQNGFCTTCASASTKNRPDLLKPGRMRSSLNGFMS